jgi:Leucine-rich repeat (LRR) protein
MTELTKLWATNNQIVNVKPLSRLINLTILNLNHNQIVDVRLLSKLTKLTRFWVIDNQISVEYCPVKPESICRFQKSSSGAVQPKTVAQ